MELGRIKPARIEPTRIRLAHNELADKELVLKKPALKRWVQRLLSSLFPSRCILCQQTVLSPAAPAATSENVELCSDCYVGLPHNTHCCSHCALPLPEDIEGDVLCGRCIKKRPSFNYSYSLFRYEDELIKLVHQLKFREKISSARSIGELLLSTVSDELLPVHGKPDVIIPVPLHNSRLRKRGYNQSTEISRVIAKKVGIPIEQNIVIRARKTLTQTGLKAKQRQKNIKGAFKVIGKFSFKHVLIVDDVITTGSTVNELAKVLKQNGVERVGVLSIARAPLKG